MEMILVNYISKQHCLLFMPLLKTSAQKASEKSVLFIFKTFLKSAHLKLAPKGHVLAIINIQRQSTWLVLRRISTYKCTMASDILGLEFAAFLSNAFRDWKVARCRCLLQEWGLRMQKGRKSKENFESGFLNMLVTTWDLSVAAIGPSLYYNQPFWNFFGRFHSPWSTLDGAPWPLWR